MEEYEQLLNQKRKEDKEDKLNCEYVKNNLNDLHNLLNEKENNEKMLKNEIYSLKLLLERKNMEYSDIINEKDREIKKLKETEGNQSNSMWQELADCLDQTSDTLDNKDKKINELLNIINITQNKNESYLREINELKLYINELEKNRNIIITKQLNENNEVNNNNEINSQDINNNNNNNKNNNNQTVINSKIIEQPNNNSLDKNNKIAEEFRTKFNNIIKNDSEYQNLFPLIQKGSYLTASIQCI